LVHFVDRYSAILSESHNVAVGELFNVDNLCEGEAANSSVIIVIDLVSLENRLFLAILW
jgi:hypothetical protein